MLCLDFCIANAHNANGKEMTKIDEKKWNSERDLCACSNEIFFVVVYT